jgi:hypothetical protein
MLNSSLGADTVQFYEASAEIPGYPSVLQARKNGV